MDKIDVLFITNSATICL